MATSEKFIAEVETKFTTSGLDAATEEARQFERALDEASATTKKLDSDLKKAGQSDPFKIPAESVKKLNASLSASGTENRLINRYDAVAKAQKEVIRVENDIARLEKQGLGNAELFARARAGAAENVARAMQRAGGAVNDNAKQFGLAGHQIQNLSFQLNDLATQIASGGGIFRPLIQQSGQVVQVLQQSGGIREGLTAVGASLRGMSATVPIIGAIAAAFATAGVAVSKYLDQQKELERVTTTGLGRASGASAESIQASAKEAAAASRLSIGEARELAVQFAKTGEIGAEFYKNLSIQTERFAQTTGMSLEDAGKLMAEAFADPAKGMQTLDKALRFLDGTQRENIRTLALQNDKIGAQHALLDALANGPMVAAEQRIRTWGDAYDYLKKKGGDTLDYLIERSGKAVSPTGGEELQTLLNLRERQTKAGLTEPPDMSRRIERLQAEANAAEASRSAAKREADALKAGALGDTAAREIIPDLEARERAIKQVGDLEAAQRALAESGRPVVESQEAIAKALEIARASAESYGSVQDTLDRQRNKMIESHQLEIEAIQAVTAEEQIAIAGKQAYAETLSRTNDAELAGVAQLNAEVETRAQLQATIEAQIPQQEAEIGLLERRISLVGESNMVREVALARYQAENALIAAGIPLNSELAQKYIANAEALARLNVELQEATFYHKALMDQQHQMIELSAQINGATESEIAMLRAKHQLIEQGMELNNQEARQFVANAGKIAEMQEQLAENRRKDAEDARRGGVTSYDAFGNPVYSNDPNRRPTHPHAGGGGGGGVASQRGFGGGPGDQGYHDALSGQMRWKPQETGASFATASGYSLTGGSGPGRVTTDMIMAMRAAATAMKVSAMSMPKESGGGGGGGGGMRMSPGELFRLTGQMPAKEPTAEQEPIDLSDLLDPVRDKISELTDKQTAIMNRAYRPDPYAERNPEMFYSGDRIYRETQDKQYAALQDQIDQLENVNANIGTLVSQGQILPGALTTSMIAALQAAGFADIGAQIASAMAPTPSATGATPTSTAVKSGALPNKSTGSSNYYSASSNVPFGGW